MSMFFFHLAAAERQVHMCQLPWLCTSLSLFLPLSRNEQSPKRRHIPTYNKYKHKTIVQWDTTHKTNAVASTKTSDNNDDNDNINIKLYLISLGFAQLCRWEVCSFCSSHSTKRDERIEENVCRKKRLQQQNIYTLLSKSLLTNEK